MKINPNAADAYIPHKPAEAPKLEVEAARRGEPKPETPASARFKAADFFTLSPTAQRYVLENMMLTAIGEKVGAQFAEQGIDLQAQIEVDQAPEAVAGRIVDFATSMFSVFEAQNPDMAQDELRAEFETTLRDAVDLGFSRAQGILEAMDDVGDEVMSLGEQTMALVHQKFDAYFAELGADAA